MTRHAIHTVVLFVPNKVEGGIEYLQLRAIHNELTQLRTVQKGGSNPQTPGKSHPAYL